MGQRHGEVKVLVAPTFSGPSLTQRAALHEAIRDVFMTAAILSTSKLIRHFIELFSLVGSVDMQGFEPNALRDALDFLDLQHVDIQWVELQIQSLHLQYDGCRSPLS